MPETLKRLLGRSPWRAIGAWLLTCYLVSVVVIAGFATLSALDSASARGEQSYWESATMAPLWGLFAGAITALASALPVWGFVSLFRIMKWPRPLSEIVAGALLGVILLQMLVGALAFGAAEGPRPFPPWLYLVFLIAGAAAGLTYWRLAGRPGRPVDAAQDALTAHIVD
jgi:hypothetical protein